jgi:hypothetical protein
MRGVVLLCLFAGVATPAEPITRLAQLSAIDQQKDDFYGALAKADKSIKASWTLDNPLTTSADSPLTLTLTNVLNPEEVKAPDLANRPEFQAAFVRIEAPSRIEFDPTTGVVKIITTVRPRNAGKLTIPELKFVYYLPVATRFQTTYAVSLERTVNAPMATAPIPLDGPPDFFVERAVTRSNDVPSWCWWALPAVLTSFAVGFVLWHRRQYPQAAERARILRIRAVRVALADLRRLPTDAPAQSLAVIWQRYLVARYGVRPTANTPQELADELARLKFPQARAAQATEMIEQLHAAQFAPKAQHVSPLPLKRLIEAWEGLPT